jgi:hypothetical protein
MDIFWGLPAIEVSTPAEGVYGLAVQLTQLASKGPYITSANFTYHKVPGGHVYPIVTIGLYNFLRIAFSN